MPENDRDLKEKALLGMSGDTTLIIDFKMKLTKSIYKLNCFPTTKNSEKTYDKDWVEVTMDTSQFSVEDGSCGIAIMDVVYEEK